METKYNKLSKRNNFHKNSQFTVQVEKEGRISFLNVLMIRDQTTVKQQHTVSPLIITSNSTGHNLHQINGKWAPFQH